MKDKEKFFKILLYVIIIVINVILIIAVGKSIGDVISSGDIEEHKKSIEEYENMEYIDGEDGDFENLDMDDVDMVDVEEDGSILKNFGF